MQTGSAKFDRDPYQQRDAPDVDPVEKTTRRWSRMEPR